ncbi:S41 family peptidase [Massilia sp. CFBP9012]|uniref:S41 family peptidase n=1 Tax=Massilia sp. CFBP9012 TaxID=3096531 RepID=UPI002A6A8B6D|nr:S41 family peptidase [Massilia sp. CFBP9012]MDY0975547.1 S41 family peptidase [Massilia sp. CFBP9012]
MHRRLLSTISRLRPLLATLVLACGPVTAADGAPPPISAAQFREDIAFVRAMIARMHPDPGFSTDPAAVHRVLDRMAHDAPPALTRDEAWQRLASVNALLADGHFVIGYPDWRKETRAWLAQGGGLFPMEVNVEPDGALYLSATPTRVVSVNGVAAAELVSTLSSLVHGDTPRFRANLLGQRWWLYYWKRFGAPETYELVLEEEGVRRTVTMSARRLLPRVLEQEARQPFDLAIGRDGQAVLTVDTFNMADPAPFLAFTRDAFARIRAQGVTSLVIDISKNGGGDDAVWLEGLMPYLATQPYRTGSTFRGLTRAPAGAPAKPMHGEIETWRQPQPGNSLRFEGKTEVRIGPATYSSAVLFANVMRDFGFATLVGAGGAARQTQSGGVRDARLPHSGLAITLPRFILDPPAGGRPGALLETTVQTRRQSQVSSR